MVMGVKGLMMDCKMDKRKITKYFEWTLWSVPGLSLVNDSCSGTNVSSTPPDNRKTQRKLRWKKKKRRKKDAEKIKKRWKDEERMKKRWRKEGDAILCFFLLQLCWTAPATVQLRWHHSYIRIRYSYTSKPVYWYFNCFSRWWLISSQIITQLIVCKSYMFL